MKQSKKIFHHRWVASFLKWIGGGGLGIPVGATIYNLKIDFRNKVLKKRTSPCYVFVSQTKSLIKRLMNLMLLYYDPQTSSFLLQLIFQYPATPNVYYATSTLTCVLQKTAEIHNIVLQTKNARLI